MTTQAYVERNLARKQKRVKEVRKKILIIIFSIVILVSILLIVNSISTQASDMEHQMTYKYYKSIEVQKGDTLWSIASLYADGYTSVISYVNEVKQMNGLDSDHIKAGYSILVPYYSTDFVSDYSSLVSR